MNVGELKRMLEKYPNDMVFINSRYSDYQIVSEGEFSVVSGVEQDGWVMRSHPTMSAKNKANEKQFLHLQGN